MELILADQDQIKTSEMILEGNQRPKGRTIQTTRIESVGLNAKGKRQGNI